MTNLKLHSTSDIRILLPLSSFNMVVKIQSKLKKASDLRKLKRTSFYIAVIVTFSWLSTYKDKAVFHTELH